MATLHMPMLFALTLLPTLAHSNLLTLLEDVSRVSRQGNLYDEGHPRDTIAIEKEYDFIIIGAGTAGSVVANRLSEIPDWKILLLEAGPGENALAEAPAVVAYFQSTSFNWGYKTQPQRAACLAMDNNSCEWPRGKLLGGTSAINYMIYTRGNRQDYDLWAQLGNTGWSYDELLPYFIKSENCKIPEYQNSPYHGTNGYLNVESIPFRSRLVDAFLEAGQELGYPIIDYNGESQYGFSRIQVNERNGSRCSASKAFLRPIRNRKNLHISMRSQVTKILIDHLTRRAYGVQFVKDKQAYTITVRREVVLSAGTLNSPQLLMLSGVGPSDHLQELDIPVIQDLKVGYNLQEHVGFLGPTFLVNQSVSVVEDRILQNPKLILDFILRGQGPVTLPGGCEGIAYITTPLQGRDGDPRPDMEFLFIAGSINSDNGGVWRGLGMRQDFYNEMFRPIKNRDAWSMWPIVVHPKSRGIVRLKDKNPFHWPIIHHDFFSDPQDLEVLVEGIKLALRVGETEAFAKLDSRLLDNEIPVPNCRHLPQGSDAYWACAARYLTGTLHHQVGTCKMGPATDTDAVVDPELRVYGIQGLRVIDASIMPLVPTCHTNAPTYMVGERGSDMIKTSWGRS